MKIKLEHSNGLNTLTAVMNALPHQSLNKVIKYLRTHPARTPEMDAKLRVLVAEQKAQREAINAIPQFEVALCVKSEKSSLLGDTKDGSIIPRSEPQFNQQ